MKEYFVSLFATPLDVVAQIIGFVAMISSVICFMQKTRTKILAWQMTYTALFAVQFFLLGANTGAAIDCMQVLMGVVYFSKENHKWAQKNIWPVLFIAVTVAAGILTYDNIYSLLPIAGNVFSCISLWMKKPLHIRLLTYPVSVCWIIYEAINRSAAGVCNDLFVLVTITVAIFTIDKKKTNGSLRK